MRYDETKHRLTRLFGDDSFTCSGIVILDEESHEIVDIEEPHQLSEKPSVGDMFEKMARIFEGIVSIRAKVNFSIKPKEVVRAIIDDQQIEFASIEEKFEALAKIWHRHIRGKSVINYAHFAYFQILTMGRSAIPFLLKEVANGVGTWYVALQYITTEMAETTSMRGDAAAVRQAWIRWGLRNGYSTELAETQTND